LSDKIEPFESLALDLAELDRYRSLGSVLELAAYKEASKQGLGSTSPKAVVGWLLAMEAKVDEDLKKVRERKRHRSPA
jgi:hypothetical protein